MIPDFRFLICLLYDCVIILFAVGGGDLWGGDLGGGDLQCIS